MLAAHEDAKRLAERVTDDLPDLLRERYDNVEWHVEHGEAEPADPAADERELIEATSVTLALATAALYAALFVTALVAAAVFIPPSALEENVRHAIGIGDDVRLSWLVASIATLGGALGSLIDSDEGVRGAAYHPR